MLVTGLLLNQNQKSQRLIEEIAYATNAKTHRDMKTRANISNI